MTWLTIVNAAATALLVAAIAVRLAIPLLARRGLIASENERTMHQGRVPKGGGIAVILAAAAVAIAFGFAGGLHWAFVAGLAITLFVSAADDRGAVSPLIRITAHFGAAVLAVSMLPQTALVFQGLLPVALDRALTVLALAALMNFFNFMDGINGIAGVEMISICVGYAAIGMLTAGAGPTEGIAIVLAAATGGFLVWNARPRPLVFLGDSGSVTFGYLAGVLMIDLAARGYWAAALILPSYFFADAFITLGQRAWRGERLWQAHRTHAYQRAAAAVGSHLQVVGVVLIANVVLLGLALASVTYPATAFLAASAVVASLLVVLERAAQRGRIV